MPELCRFDGMTIRMLYRDNDKHHKPHIHVVCGEHEMSIGIDGETLGGTLPKRQFTLLRAWLILHEDELYAAWNNAVREKPFGKIEPLR